MWKSIIYKEWLKVRWFLIIYAGLGILAIGNIFIKVQHDFVFHEAQNYWYSVLFQGFQYFRYVKFLPLAGALAIAVAQYFPETVNKRIKLAFHLPVNENKVLVMMMVFGTVCLFLCYALMFLAFWGMSTVFFPAEILHAAIISVLPWFLAGFAAYYFVALIVLEPVWKFRFLYFAAACAFIPLYIQYTVSGGYAPVNLKLAGLVVLLSISLLFSGYRFRKGEM